MTPISVADLFPTESERQVGAYVNVDRPHVSGVCCFHIPRTATITESEIAQLTPGVVWFNVSLTDELVSEIQNRASSVTIARLTRERDEAIATALYLRFQLATALGQTTIEEQREFYRKRDGITR